MGHHEPESQLHVQESNPRREVRVTGIVAKPTVEGGSEFVHVLLKKADRVLS